MDCGRLGRGEKALGKSSFREPRPAAWARDENKHAASKCGGWCVPDAKAFRREARLLLRLLLDAFTPAGLVVLGIDDTIERRRGKRIAAKGIYRDPVRSSHGHWD